MDCYANISQKDQTCITGPASTSHQVAAELNDRPRKTLHDYTPHQLMRRSHREEHTDPIRIDR